MRDVVDPELGINVVDLGLVYDIWVRPGKTEGSVIARVDMTLTSAECPLTDVIEDQAQSATVGADLVNELELNWVWMPPWGPQMITDDGANSFAPSGSRSRRISWGPTPGSPAGQPRRTRQGRHDRALLFAGAPPSCRPCVAQASSPTCSTWRHPPDTRDWRRPETSAADVTRGGRRRRPTRHGSVIRSNTRNPTACSAVLRQGGPGSADPNPVHDCRGNALGIAATE